MFRYSLADQKIKIVMLFIVIAASQFLCYFYMGDLFFWSGRGFAAMTW